MKSEDCIFCRIASNQIPSIKIYEDEDVFAFLDIGPVSDGHTLIIPKAHYGKLHECPADILSCLSGCLATIAKAVVDAVQADGYNILCNNGRAAGQIVEHLHFHIIPRKGGDSVFNRWPAYEYEQGKAEEIAARIRKIL